MTTFIGHPDGSWKFIKDEPQTFSSSQGVTRAFCANCGSPIYYRSEQIPGETHFYAVLLEHPENVVPTVHWHYDEMLPWLHITDNADKKGV